MKITLHVKLGIGVLVLFAAALLGMSLYEPAWFKYQFSRLDSDDPAVRFEAAGKIAAWEEKAGPYLEKMLASGSLRMIESTCAVLDRMDVRGKAGHLPMLRKILAQNPSGKTDAAARIIASMRAEFDPDNEMLFELEYRECGYPISNEDLGHAEIRNLYIYLFKNRDDTEALEIYTLILKKHADEPLVRKAMEILTHDPDENRRRFAALLVAAPRLPWAVHALADALEKDASETVRKAAAKGLGIVGSDAAMKPLAASLENDSSEDVRAAAAEGLGYTDDFSAAGALMDATADKSELVRAAAARALGRLGPPGCGKALVQLLANDPDESVRKAVARALGDLIDLETVDALIEALKDPSEDVGKAVIKQLGKIGDERAIEPVIALLERGKNMGIRRRCISALGNFKGKKVVNNALEKIYNNPNDPISLYALYAAANLGDKRAFEPLIKKLEKSPGSDKSMVLNALAELSDKRALDAIAAVLANTSFITDVRQSAAYALGKIGDHRAIEPLMDTLKNDRDVLVKSMAASALGALKRTEVVEPLVQAASNSSFFAIRREIVLALSDFEDPRIPGLLMKQFGKSGPIDPQIVQAVGKRRIKSAVEPLLAKLKTEKDDWDLAAIIEALGAIGDERAIEPIAAIARKDVYNWRTRTAVRALANFNQERARTTLENVLLESRHTVFREWAAYSLGEIGSPESLPVLKKAFKNQERDIIREAIVYALGSTESPDAAPLLMQTLDADPDESTRADSAWALLRIGCREAADLMLEKMKTDKSPLVRARCAAALGFLGTPETRKDLRSAMESGNPGACIALGWFGDRDALEALVKMESFPKMRDAYEDFGSDEHPVHAFRTRLDDWVLETFRDAALVKNGRALDLDDFWFFCVKIPPLIREVSAILPKGFPEYDFSAPFAARKQQLDRMSLWLPWNRDRLKWNKESGRYFLAPKK